MVSGDKDDLNAFGNLCTSQHERVCKFRNDYPELEMVLGTALDAGRLIIGSISLIRGMTMIESHRWLMWQSIFEYQKQSLLLLVTGNTDAGLALIRLAAELARDVAVIRNHAERLDLWRKRRDPKWRREYQQVFRFDDVAWAGMMAHKAYDLCSEFGVHGHVSDAMSLEPVRQVSASGCDQFVLLKVSDSGVLRALRIWLTAFGPLHLLCLETFGEKHGHALGEPSRLFMDMVDAIGPVLKNLGARPHD